MVLGAASVQNSTTISPSVVLMTATSLVFAGVLMVAVVGVFVLVSSAKAVTIPAAKTMAQIRLNVFMGVKFSRSAAKSHARNWTFQVIGGGNFLSSFLSSCLPVSLSSFIARVMRLVWSALRERRSMNTVRPPATARNATPMAKTPFRPVPELSDGGAAVILD